MRTIDCSANLLARALARLALAMLALLGCTDLPTNARSSLTAFSIDAVHDSVLLGRTSRFKAVAVGDSAVVNKGPYTWSSEDTTVAVVDSTGKVLGVGVGQTRIAVDLDGHRALKTIRVVLQRVDGGVALTLGPSSEGTTSLCATSNGRVYCRPFPFQTDTMPVMKQQPGAASVRLSSPQSSLHAVCALSDEGRIYCWGTNAHFIFGNNSQIPTDTGPVVVRTDLRFSQIVHSGHAQTCGISRADSVVYCWGHNDAYQLARGFASSMDSVITPVAGSFKAGGVFSANFASCTLDLDGAARCAGWLNFTLSNLGIAESSDAARTLLPVVGNRHFSSLTFAGQAICGLELTGDTYCWGANRFGELGIGSKDVTFGPQRLSGEIKFKAIASAGGYCGIDVVGDVYCWGANFLPGAIASRRGDKSLRPTLLIKGLKAKQIAGGLSAMCIVTESSQTLCW